VKVTRARRAERRRRSSAVARARPAILGASPAALASLVNAFVVVAAVIAAGRSRRALAIAALLALPTLLFAVLGRATEDPRYPRGLVRDGRGALPGRGGVPLALRHAPRRPDAILIARLAGSYSPEEPER